MRAALAGAEAEFRDANHNCWAYRLGPEPETEHFSDGGEPAGTAGKPILAAVRQSGMVNLMVVVTRYFGGVKLGVRGLTEAYGQTAGVAVALASRARRVRSRRLAVRLPCGAIGDVARLLDVYGGTGLVWSYGVGADGAEAEAAADVRLSAATLAAAALDELRARRRIHSWEWSDGT